MLRYPGGKLRLMKKINSLIVDMYGDEAKSDWEVCEPFTGGGGSLINMAKDFPNWKFHINDFNPEISKMWEFFYKADSSMYEDLYSKIRNQSATLSEYNNIFNCSPSNLLDNAFRIIFLNKTSFGGFVTKNRPIGGVTQSSKWKVDVYWNPANIIKGIEKMRSALQGKILSVSCLDFETFLSDKNPNFIYGDPPYIAFGKEWYNCSFDLKDLKRMQRALSAHSKWCVSIDKSAVIEEIFDVNYRLDLEVKHTAKSSYKAAREDNHIASARELVIFPNKTNPYSFLLF